VIGISFFSFLLSLSLCVYVWCNILELFVFVIELNWPQVGVLLVLDWDFLLNFWDLNIHFGPTPWIQVYQNINFKQNVISLTISFHWWC
jgi:hypothetical protein